MARQELEAQSHRPHSDIGYGRVGHRPLLLLFPDHNLDHSQEQRQPGRSSDDHGEDHADHEEGAQHVSDARDQRAEAIDADHPAVDECEEASEKELQDCEIAIGPCQR